MKNFGKMWVVLVVILVVILLFGLGIFRWYIGNYNRPVALEEITRDAWSNVDTTLQRRLDLIPNLVQTVKGYAEHEKELFENIAKSREKYFQANSVAGKIQASNELTGFLSRLLVLQERYPDLKANQNFLSLQDQLEGTENRINVARTRYNEAVRQLNTYARSFFGSYFCRKRGVEQAEYFEASEQAKTEVPKVEF
ncbi:MAG: LemA family protein [Phycisphaerales bacterium]|nr:MAG: LemA family protein [Phycisphaerales bacterium]